MAAKNPVWNIVRNYAQNNEVTLKTLMLQKYPGGSKSQGKKKSMVKTSFILYISVSCLTPNPPQSSWSDMYMHWIFYFYFFFAFPCLPIQRTPTGTDQSWSRPVHLPNAAHKVLSSILCLFWLHLAELVRSDEPNTFFAVWQEDVQSAASNLPALFKGLNSGWPWPQTASCLALGGSGILVCFIARDSCTKPGRVPLLKLLQSLEPNRINAIKKSSQEWSACPCFSSTQTRPTQGYLYTSPQPSQSKAMTDMDNKPNKGVGVSLTRLCLSACNPPSQRLRALWLSWPKVS